MQLFVGCFPYISEFEMTRNAEKLLGHVVTTPTICCKSKEKNNFGLRYHLCFDIVEAEIVIYVIQTLIEDIDPLYQPNILYYVTVVNVIIPSTNLTFLFYFYAVTVNVLPLESTVWSHVHVKTASTSLFMKILSLQLANRLNQETLLLLLLK